MTTATATRYPMSFPFVSLIFRGGFLSFPPRRPFNQNRPTEQINQHRRGRHTRRCPWANCFTRSSVYPHSLTQPLPRPPHCGGGGGGAASRRLASSRRPMMPPPPPTPSFLVRQSQSVMAPIHFGSDSAMAEKRYDVNFLKMLKPYVIKARGVGTY